MTPRAHATLLAALAAATLVAGPAGAQDTRFRVSLGTSDPATIVVGRALHGSVAVMLRRSSVVRLRVEAHAAVADVVYWGFPAGEDPMTTPGRQVDRGAQEVFGLGGFVEAGPRSGTIRPYWFAGPAVYRSDWRTQGRPGVEYEPVAGMGWAFELWGRPLLAEVTWRSIGRVVWYKGDGLYDSAALDAVLFSVGVGL